MSSVLTHVGALTSADWERTVLQSPVPVLVEFGAPWCPPCRRIGPEIEAVAEEMGERARVFTVDVDNEPEIGARYGVQQIPALLIFKNGAVVDQRTGFRPRTQILETLKPHVE